MTSAVAPIEYSDEATRKTTRIDDVTVHYHEVGSGEPLLLLPPWGPSPGVTAWMSMNRVMFALGQHFRVIALDLVNYGRTGPRTYAEPIHHVDATLAIRLLDHLGIGDPVAAVGTSQGATTCLVLALLHPERIEKLVIGSCHASTGGDPYVLSAFPSEGARLARDYDLNPSRDALSRLLRSMFYDESLITEELLTYFERVRGNAQAHLQATRASVSARHSNLSGLERIEIPTLIVHGRFDRRVPCEQAITLLNYLRSSDLVILNRCGHWPLYERPQDWLSWVLPFLLQDRAR